MIKYSIVMPVYNSGKNLNQSIDSVINQIYSNWELIIIDDGSTDDSAEIINNYVNKDNRIKLYLQKNQGPGIARNNGIKKCQGDYIAFLDSDDYYDNDFLYLVNKENEKEMQDVIFIGDIKEYKNGKVFGGYSFYKYKNKTKDELLKMQMMGTIPWGGVLKVVRSEIAKSSKYTHLVVGEELIYSINVIMKSSKFAFVEKKTYHYVHNEVGQHTLGGLDPWNEVAFGLKEYLKKNDLYYTYEAEINGLAFKALTINLYRISCNYRFKDAIIKYKKAICNYKEKYNFEIINFNLLDNTSKIIFYLSKLKLYSIIYLCSRIRKG